MLTELNYHSTFGLLQRRCSVGLVFPQNQLTEQLLPTVAFQLHPVAGITVQGISAEACADAQDLYHAKQCMEYLLLDSVQNAVKT